MARFTYRGNSRVYIAASAVTLTEVGLGSATDLTAQVRQWSGGDLDAAVTEVLSVGVLENTQRFGPASLRPIVVTMYDALASGDRVTVAQGDHVLYLVTGPADGTALADVYTVQTLGSFRVPTVANEAATTVTRFAQTAAPLRDQAVPAS